MDNQSFEFFPQGNKPTYKNTWRHTIVGIGLMAVGVAIFYVIGKHEWHKTLLIILGVWTFLLIYKTYTNRFIIKIQINKITGEVIIYYFTVNGDEQIKTFNIRESDITYKLEGGRAPSNPWRLRISDQELHLHYLAPPGNYQIQ